MGHTVRSRRKANEKRRRTAAQNQKPLPPEEQKRRAEERRAEKVARYPVPPRYRPAHNAKAPEQPRCYGTEWDRFMWLRGTRAA